MTEKDKAALVPAAGVGMQKLVSRLQKHADEMAAENGSVEPDTNAWVPSNDWIETYLEGVDKCLEIVKAAAPEPEKAQGDDVMTDKELRDWIFQWSQNEGKIPLESDINDLIWTIQKYATPAVSPADAGVESAGELAEKIYEWCACLTRDDAENQIRGLLGRLSSRASLSAGQGVAVPEGYALVPLEPDENMRSNGSFNFCGSDIAQDEVAEIYKAMIAASPATKSQPSGVVK